MWAEPSYGSIAICVVVYLLVAFAVGSSLPLDRIVAAKDYALAEAAQPSPGQTGFYLTVALALVATASGLIARVFAVSRMLAMLTDMKKNPHSHFEISSSWSASSAWRWCSCSSGFSWRAIQSGKALTTITKKSLSFQSLEALS